MKTPTWLKGLLTLVAALLTREIILQIISTIPAAYLLSVTIEFALGAILAADTISPLFRPILSILLLAVLFRPAFVVPFMEWRNRPSQLRLEIEEAHKLLSYIYEPDRIPTDCPYNYTQIAQLAEDKVNDLIQKLPKEFRHYLPATS